MADEWLAAKLVDWGLQDLLKTFEDLDFADDIALLADSLRDAEELLHLAALTVGLSMNAKKTKAMVCNMDASPIRTLDGSELEVVDDFKYLGAWIGSEKDFNIRKAQAWRACNSMNKIWKSSPPRNLKTKLFTTTVESVLMYGADPLKACSLLSYLL
ncbi:uncharacterized protein [Amphiura filiformis]|uniref:uncharacterized protein n=1 Tax=Amphiura filiformis TaxID=82378 RepID=UPI003B216670